MSGRRIDDHSFFAGGKSKESVLPTGVHVKSQPSGEGAGTLSKYEDTSEEIKKSQDMARGKVKSYGNKENHRY